MQNAALKPGAFCICESEEVPTVMGKKDFFVSYNKADESWAEWIAWQLEEAGFSVIIQAWDFLPGQNFVLCMQHATIQATRTITVLSPDFLSAKFTQPEWTAAFAQDPNGLAGTLLPVRVRPCELVGLLPQIIYVDLVGKNADEARAALLEATTSNRRKPQETPLFPVSIDTLSINSTDNKLGRSRGAIVESTLKANLGRDLVGTWEARFCYIDGESYIERIEIRDFEDGTFLGRIIPSWDNCAHTATIDHLKPVRLRGELGGTQFLTGIWYHSSQVGKHGAFQLQISSEADTLNGGWMKYSESLNDIISGRWDWVRVQSRRNPVIGIYGVTGAGKTTLCSELVKSNNARAFSESEVLDRYMRHIRNENFEDFKNETEIERMKIREEAFLLHSTRIRNSDGIIFGDAHYSFPRERLGKIEYLHPEEERGIQPVMPEAAWLLYDSIVYIDTPAHVVMKRINDQTTNTSRNYWAKSLNIDQIDYWIQYERRKLENECIRRSHNFISISGDVSPRDIADAVYSFSIDIDRGYHLSYY